MKAPPPLAALHHRLPVGVGSNLRVARRKVARIRGAEADPFFDIGNDRGLQHFSARLPKGKGSVICRIDPGDFGEYAYDWTGWTGIAFK